MKFFIAFLSSALYRIQIKESCEKAEVVGKAAKSAKPEPTKAAAPAAKAGSAKPKPGAPPRKVDFALTYH